VVTRRETRGANAANGSFTVLFTALSIILLAFFILMTSMSVPDPTRRFKAVGSLGSAFGLFQDGTTSVAVADRDATDAAIDRGGADRGNAEQIAARFSRRMAEIGGAYGVEVQRGHDDWTVRLDGDVLFAPGDATLNDMGRRLLGKLAPALLDFPGAVQVAGHSDASAADRGDHDPWHLSAARAVNVMRYLHEACGIDRDRLTAVGYGPYWPLADNDTEAGRRHNRRVELVLVHAGDWQRADASGGDRGSH
jgi:chemotaxis protein MotB